MSVTELRGCAPSRLEVKVKRNVAAALAVVAVLITTSCSADGGAGGEDASASEIVDDGTVLVPASSDDFEGRQYEEVVKDLQDAGFTSVEATPLGDLITGWTKDPGEVKEVTIGGSSFNDDARFTADTTVVVSYHSFPPDPEDTMLTIEDSEDLRALLAGPSFGAPLEQFVDAHQGETIILDGYITYFLYGSSVIYSTADVRVGAAGVDPGTGPTFRFTPMLVPEDSPIAGDELAEGMSVRITATIGTADVFEKDSFYDPETEDRIDIVISSIEPR